MQTTVINNNTVKNVAIPTMMDDNTTDTTPTVINATAVAATVPSAAVKNKVRNEQKHGDIEAYSGANKTPAAPINKYAQNTTPTGTKPRPYNTPRTTPAKMPTTMAVQEQLFL